MDTKAKNTEKRMKNEWIALTDEELDEVAGGEEQKKPVSFKCPFCPRTFTSINERNVHMEQCPYNDHKGI